MIYGQLENMAHEISVVPGIVLEGLRFLEGKDFASLPAGRIDIDGDRVFALVQDYRTKPETEVRPEAHSRYLDIQFIDSGCKKIGFASSTDAPPAVEDYSEERDIRFYDHVPHESSLLMTAGSYAVFFPWDIHRPGCSISEPCDVRKILVKIDMLHNR